MTRRNSSRSNTGSDAHQGRGRFLFRALFLFPLLSGCYYLRQGAGQLEIITGSRPLTDVYGDPGLSDAQARKLDLVRGAKRFAEERIGLKVTSNYTTFFDNKRRQATFVVSAVRKDRFEAKTWSFLVVGSLPYIGYFDRKDAEDEVAKLKAEGDWDVVLGESSAYSTLGWFRDPVFASMLGMSDSDLALTIIHELVHGTIYLDDHADFNESLAQFVGVEGTIQFFTERYGRDHAMTRYARANFDEDQRLDAFLRDVYARLDRLYTSDASREQKLARREEIFDGARAEWSRQGGGDLNLDNARIVARIRYGRYNSFKRVFERAQSSWPAFFATVSAAVETGRPLETVEAPAGSR